MTNSNPKPTRVFERGNTVVIALIVLVLVAVGAIAYLSGNIGGQDETAATQTAATEPAAAAGDVQPEQTAAAPNAEDLPPMPEIKEGNPVVAKLDGENITRVDVLNYIQGMGPQVQQMRIDQLFPLALDQLVTAEIVTDKVKSVNLDNDPLVKEQMAAAKEQIVRGVFMQRQVEKAMTDERLKEAYDLYVANFPEIEEVKTRHILVEDEKLAKDLIKQIKDGADFAELAKANSIDPTKDKGGELGYMAKTDQVIPEYLEAAFKQDVGEISKKPVKTDFGYHIIEVQEERIRPPASFEQAKPFLASQLRNAVLTDLVSKWRKEANVALFDINGDPIEPAAGAETPEPAAEAPAEAEAAPAEEAPAEDE